MSTRARSHVAIAAVAILALGTAGAVASDAPPRTSEFFDRFDLPDEWEARFWATPGVDGLLKLDAKALAALVPTQAGLKHCRCPSCLAPESDDPLGWSPAKPDVLTCRQCGVVVPNDKFPGKVPPAPGQPPTIPEESIEVVPRTVHKYPYHLVDPVKQAYPDERLYLQAKRDYEAREFLSKLALYAAVRHRERRDEARARAASVLLVRFAQAYPAYATHLDQPGQAKVLQRADLAPPYRRGYQTAKWDWSGSLDVPLNLVIAYALIRDDPSLLAAGRELNDPNPSRTIERDLFRASAEFVRRQPEAYSEASLLAYRGMLAVGRLCDDPVLIGDVMLRLQGFAERGFYHDGLWRQGDATAHHRVLGLLDGWIGRLAPGGGVAILALARSAGRASLADPRVAEVQRASWPATALEIQARAPALLGGAALARLGVGRGADALDLELRGQGDLGSGRHHRLSLRLAAGGRILLGDLDDQAPTIDGWDRATASHNTVVVDGLNQRETIEGARQPANGSDVRFFAATPTFQVALLDDRHAYPRSTTRYRHLLAACAGPRSRYALSVFEVHGGLQHDWLAHAAAGSAARWVTSVPLTRGPRTLLPPAVPFLPNTRAEDGRWFVQAYGHFEGLSVAKVDRPALATLARPDGAGVRLHVLGDVPITILTAVTPDPNAPPADRDAGRSALIVRRRSEDGATLKSTFVTVFEPLGTAPALRRVGRVASPAGTLVLLVETGDGPEHVVVNLEPGKSQTVTLADGQPLRTDGLVARLSGQGLAVAGGTFAEGSGRRVDQPKVTGTVRSVTREAGSGTLGWFEVDGEVSDPAPLAGRVLLIQHGDGSTRGWTIAHAEPIGQGRTRLFVREEPGFVLDPESGAARYYQFPRVEARGPHHFSVGGIAL